MNQQPQQQPIPQPEKPKKKFYKKWWFWVVIFLALVLVAALIWFFYFFAWDGGNACKDSSECSSDWCLVEEGGVELFQKNVEGRCFRWKANFPGNGCYHYLQDYEVHSVCID